MLPGSEKTSYGTSDIAKFPSEKHDFSLKSRNSPFNFSMNVIPDSIWYFLKFQGKLFRTFLVNKYLIRRNLATRYVRMCLRRFSSARQHNTRIKEYRLRNTRNSDAVIGQPRCLSYRPSIHRFFVRVRIFIHFERNAVERSIASIHRCLSSIFCTAMNHAS